MEINLNDSGHFTISRQGEALYNLDDMLSILSMFGYTCMIINGYDVNVGEPCLISVSLPEDASDTVTFKVDDIVTTVQIEEGYAMFEYYPSTAGTKVITIIYNGDGTTKTKIINVSKTNPDIFISCDEQYSYGSNFNIKIYLPYDATGQVTLKVDGNNYGTETKDADAGTVNFTMNNLSRGTHTIAAEYSGNDKYNPGTSSKQITIV